MLVFNVLSQTNPKISENNFDYKTLSQMFFTCLKLIQSFIKFDMNVLKIENFTENLIAYLNETNISVISEIFCDSIAFSKNAKYYSTNEDYDLNSIITNMDQKEIQTIQNLVYFIKDLTGKYYDQQSTNKEIIIGIANIFSTITENFIQFLFYVTFLLNNFRKTPFRTIFRNLFCFSEHIKTERSPTNSLKL